jgi:hypothetical protein
MSQKIVYDGLTRNQMINRIHMETDTSSWCYKSNDEELTKGYIEVFGKPMDERTKLILEVASVAQQAIDNGNDIVKTVKQRYGV